MKPFNAVCGVIVGIALAIFATGPVVALAGTVCDQGQPGSYGAWPVKAAASTPLFVNTAAQTSCATSEVLVLNSASTALTVPAGVRMIEIYNHGPNNIYCNLAAAAVVDKARPIAPEGAWGITANDTALASLACIAKTADQVTGAATILSSCK